MSRSERNAYPFHNSIGQTPRNAVMPNYTVVESKHWVHAVTGATASIYGACPWTSEADRVNWHLVTRGFTVQAKSGVVGIGRQPWPTREEAQIWADSQG